MAAVRFILFIVVSFKSSVVVDAAALFRDITSSPLRVHWQNGDRVFLGSVSVAEKNRRFPIAGSGDSDTVCGKNGVTFEHVHLRVGPNRWFHVFGNKTP